MEDIKKEFERRFCDSYTIETLLRQACTERTVDVSHVFQFIEQKCVPKSEVCKVELLAKANERKRIITIIDEENYKHDLSYIQPYVDSITDRITSGLDNPVEHYEKENAILRKENAELKEQLQQQRNSAIDECIEKVNTDIDKAQKRIADSETGDNWFSRVTALGQLKIELQQLKKEAQ